MNKKLVLALLGAAVMAMPASAFAAPCKDAKGKFIKCPPAAAAPMAKPATAKKAPCRDAKGHFKKC